MWPFGKKARNRLASGPDSAAGTEPGLVAVLTSIVSPSAVVSPFTGMRAAIILVEVVERIPLANEHGRTDDVVSDHYELLGTVVLGDVATLRDLDGDEVTVVANRARIQPANPARGGTPISRVPAEVVPLLQRSTGRGVVCYRELTLGTGDKLLLKALVEPTRSVVTSGYRSATRRTYVVRDDLAPVVLEEVFEAPPW